MGEVVSVAAKLAPFAAMAFGGPAGAAAFGGMGGLGGFGTALNIFSTVAPLLMGGEEQKAAAGPAAPTIEDPKGPTEDQVAQQQQEEARGQALRRRASQKGTSLSRLKAGEDKAKSSVTTLIGE